MKHFFFAIQKFFASLAVHLAISILKMIGKDRITNLQSNSILLKSVTSLGRKVSSKKNHYLLSNLEKIFPNKPTTERLELAADVYKNNLVTMLESATINSKTIERITIEGQTNIPLTSPNGIFFITMHLNCWDMIHLVLNRLNYDPYLFYRDFSDHVFDHWQINKKNRLPKKSVSSKNIKYLQDLIADNTNLIFANDLKVKKGRNGQHLSFASKPAWTSSFVAEMAINHNKVIVPTFIIRLDNGDNKAVFEPPIDTRSGDKNTVSQLINDSYSRKLLEYPENWALWDTNRWGP